MTGKRIVHVVDDDAAVRRALVRLLRSEGLEAVAYESALGVLNAAPSLSSGCILLDLQMPGMDGLELLVGSANSPSAAGHCRDRPWRYSDCVGP
jgi:two-component system response regulator FixJ